jgi:hypothetical protein
VTDGGKSQEKQSPGSHGPGTGPKPPKKPEHERPAIPEWPNEPKSWPEAEPSGDIGDVGWDNIGEDDVGRGPHGPGSGPKKPT